MFLVVVIVNLISDAMVKVQAVIAGVQVDVILLDILPESLNPGIISGSSFSIH